MGDPKKLRKQYQTPAHPWNATAIAAERVIKREYGLLRKKEIFKMNSFLKKYRAIAKRLSVDQSAQAQKETAAILGKLFRLGLVSQDAHLADILSLELKDVLARRLQSVVFKKGLARSMKQARQFIVHRHILVGEKEITSPSYLLTTEEEAIVSFKAKSTLADEGHPERADPKKLAAEKKKAEAAAKAAQEEAAKEVPAKETAAPEAKEEAAKAE